MVNTEEQITESLAEVIQEDFRTDKIDDEIEPFKQARTELFKI